ncbi:TPA: hypothetical protein NJ081_002915, partial [Vibrio parahaemolyticus]|nr:hypothetical protein [Vibrio parahaemolyticus]
KEEYEHFGWRFGPYKYDEIYDEVFTACVDGSLRIANSARLGMVPIPDYYIYIDIDDLVNWMLVQKRDGGNLVPSCLASACSFSELFQFYDKDSEAKGIYKECEHNPTPELALFFGEIESEEPSSIAVLQRELKLARQEISRLNNVLQKTNALLERKSPKVFTLCQAIAELHDILLNGTYNKPRMYQTDESLIDELDIHHKDWLNRPSKRTYQDIFATAKIIQKQNR